MEQSLIYIASGLMIGLGAVAGAVVMALGHWERCASSDMLGNIVGIFTRLASAVRNGVAIDVGNVVFVGLGGSARGDG